MNNCPIKRTAEEWERVCQANCQHNFGTLHAKEGKFCPVCLWPIDKCQHRKAGATDVFCKDCGERLIQDK